jgi:hypothetical protein
LAASEGPVARACESAGWLVRGADAGWAGTRWRMIDCDRVDRVWRSGVGVSPCDVGRDAVTSGGGCGVG